MTTSNRSKVIGLLLAITVLSIPEVRFILRAYMQVRAGNYAAVPYLILLVVLLAFCIAFAISLSGKRSAPKPDSTVGVTSNNRWRGP